MSSESLTKNAVRDSARMVATELVRGPVKEAVHEALREEGVTASTASREHHDVPVQESEESGGRSSLLWGALLVGVVGLAYVARRRMRSNQESWSGPSPESVATQESEDGYDSEGEMQTAEGAGESEDVSHSTSDQ